MVARVVISKAVRNDAVIDIDVDLAMCQWAVPLSRDGLFSMYLLFGDQHTLLQI
jgi:hypothetical protein